MTDSLKSTTLALAEAERKLTHLAQAILEFADDDMMRTELLERCADACLFLAKLDGVTRLASDYLEQLALAQKDTPQ